MRCCAILTTGIDPNNWYQSQAVSELGGVKTRRKSETGGVRASGSQSQAVLEPGGVRARRNSPRSVKMESSRIGTEKFDGSDFSF